MLDVSLELGVGGVGIGGPKAEVDGLVAEVVVDAGIMSCSWEAAEGPVIHGAGVAGTVPGGGALIIIQGGACCGHFSIFVVMSNKERRKQESLRTNQIRFNKPLPLVDETTYPHKVHFHRQGSIKIPFGLLCRFS